MSFWIGLAIGLLAGTAIGTLLTCVLVVAGEADLIAGRAPW